jgi:hypothetical protein
VVVGTGVSSVRVWVTRRLPVTHLRQMMLDELQRRNYSSNTVRSYVHAVEEFARYFRRRSPDQLGPDHIRFASIRFICSGLQAFATYPRGPDRSAAVSVRQDTWAILPARSDSVPQVPQAPAYCIESGRSDEADRLSQQSDAAGDDHDALCDGSLSDRVVSAEGLRYRQRTHGPSRSARQGRA